MPEFEEGRLRDFELGDTYFHKEHGVITFNIGIWANRSDKVIRP